eukprot:jgi/Chrzof1/12065/Cz06g20040.t1
MAAALCKFSLRAAPCRRPLQQKHIPALQQRPVLHVRGIVQVVRVAKVDLEEDVKPKVAIEEDDFTDGPEVAPTTQQVQDFLNVLCDETNIAEMELKLGTFQLKVRRNVEGASGGVAAAIPMTHSSVTVTAAAPSPASSAAATAAPTAEDSVAEESMDEALVYVSSPKVGIFRRGKYAAGKRVGKGNQINEGDNVKRGQPVGFVEQLGTFVPVEAPQAGEIVAFQVKDGEAVEYKQVLVELAPFFGGHIIGDRKYA